MAAKWQRTFLREERADRSASRPRLAAAATWRTRMKQFHAPLAIVRATSRGRLAVRWLAALLLYVGVASLWAISPQLTATTPAGAHRGTEIEVTLRGERLADAQQLIQYSPGIQVAKLKVPPNQPS